MLTSKDMLTNILGCFSDKHPLVITDSVKELSYAMWDVGSRKSWRKTPQVRERADARRAVGEALALVT